MIAASHPDVAAATAAGSMALANQLARTARIHPERVALQLDDTRRTYTELDRRVSYPITVSDIRRWAMAVYYPEEPPRLFWDEEYARATRHGGIVAPEASFGPPLYAGASWT